jgi:hypothetical protein
VCDSGCWNAECSARQFNGSSTVPSDSGGNMKKRLMRRLACGAVAGVALTAIGAAPAATIAWTDWGAVSLPNGTASGTITPTGGGTPINVSLSGPNDGGSITGTFNFGPAATYVGGVVSNPPCTGTTTCNGDIINLLGATGAGATETLTFSSPIVNPVFAIWSLGQSGNPTSLTFPAGTSPQIQSTGPNVPFGFVSLVANGNVVTGVEGNGTFVLPGTFPSITFQAGFENFYGFTVGQAGPLSAVPEPETYALMIAGLAVLAVAARRRPQPFAT